ncbi:hypothetical protein AB1N83_009516 [Pleurotus pulmonarius]
MATKKIDPSVQAASRALFIDNPTDVAIHRYYRRSKADDHKHARLGNLTNPLHLLDRHSIVTASYEPTKRPLDDRQTPPAPHAKIYSFFTAGFLVYTESASLFPYFRLDPSTSSDSPLRTQL